MPVTPADELKRRVQRLAAAILHREEAVAAVEQSQPKVSNHLACLRWCGFVDSRREGRTVRYRVADERVSELLALGRALLVDNAEHVAACRVSAHRRWLLMSRGDLLAPLGVAAALVCCARLPAVVAFAGGLAVGNLLGAGLLVALVVGALAGRNRRRACSPAASDREVRP